MRTPSRPVHVQCCVVAAALLFTACADPREAFVGTWSGPLRTIVRFRDGTTETYPQGEIVVVISAPERSNQLTFNGKCAMTATVNSDEAFSINRKACPSERISFDSGSGGTVSCDLSETVNGGSGRRTQSSLTVSWFGDSQLTRCTNGLSDLATYTAEATLSQ